MPFKESLEKILNEILTLAKNKKKKTVFTIGIAPRKRDIKETFFPFMRESSLFVIGNVEVTNLDQALNIVKIIDGIIDYIIIDDEKKLKTLYDLTNEIKKIVKHSIVLTYKDNDAWVEATDALISLFLDTNLGKKILIFNVNNLSTKLALKLCERGSEVYLIDEKNKNISSIIESLNFLLIKDCPSKIKLMQKFENIQFDIVIGFAIDEAVIKLDFIKKLSTNTIVIDAGIGSISEDGIIYALQNNINIFRLDMRAGLSGNIVNVIETDDLKKNVYGRKKIGNFNIVAGGFFGLKGDVVVDSITAPKKVIGVANGKGHLLSDEDLKDYEERIKIVEEEFINKI